ncbi:MAG: hypothetical protein JXM79_01330 [Sedimentisphaerales bacterium]|nr:hypothetical protein [Sedimentisphaerales bacterium]
MSKRSVAIGSWPTPDKPSTTVEVPTRLLEEFREDARVVLRHPWIIGIPLNEVLLKRLFENRKLRGELREEFDVFLVPKQGKI